MHIQHTHLFAATHMTHTQTHHTHTCLARHVTHTQQTHIFAITLHVEAEPSLRPPLLGSLLICHTHAHTHTVDQTHNHTQIHNHTSTHSQSIIHTITQVHARTINKSHTHRPVAPSSAPPTTAAPLAAWVWEPPQATLAVGWVVCGCGFPPPTNPLPPTTWIA
jgi:TnpA family transposase